LTSATVFAVEDTTVQVVWREAGEVRATTFTGLAPDADVELTPSPATGPVRARTLAPPPGPELCRVATINDLHIGTRSFGFLKTIRERPEPRELHAVRCARAALAEALAWGARFLVVKGDLTNKATVDEWAQVGDLLAGLPVPVAVVPGNHDVHPDRDVDPQPGLRRHGLHVVHGVEAVDLPGTRLLLVDTAIPEEAGGRVAHVQDEVVRLLRRAAAAGRSGLVAMHHHPQRFRWPTFIPKGIPGPEAKRFLDAVAEANRDTLVTTGHTHRHRRHRWTPVPVSEVGATKDYPGTWTGYVIHEGGIRQVVRRIEEPSCLHWTERTRRAALGAWRWWSPGRLDDRCFSITWSTTAPGAAGPGGT
jgi:3',5'-cyclic-AMP phosphodiesterase